MSHLRLIPIAALWLAPLAGFGQTAPSPAPASGPVATMRADLLKPGMKATAWTVFEGSEPEAVPIEIIGLWKNAWGPKQDIILGKMGGRAARTNVAGGMSGSPVYVDGKLIGAVALRMSVFSPDAICGITPIDLMLEINEFEKSKPVAPKAPGVAPVKKAELAVPGNFSGEAASSAPLMIPIETPLTLSGFHEETLRQFAPFFDQIGVRAVMGGGGGSTYETKPAADWKASLKPGQAVAGILVSGDMSVTGLGTVTYNDGRRVLAFGHPFFNLGPVDMPMSRGEILMVLASQFQPNKFGNATEVVGALKQDRHSGIMGVLGEQAPTIPVTMKVRALDEAGKPAREKDLRFNVFVQQKWTPFLMMLTLFNAVQGLNEFGDDLSFRLSGQVEIDGLKRLDLSTMQSPSDVPMPTPMVLASWWGDKFNRIFGNAATAPNLKRVDVRLDLIPERRSATVESAWASQTDAAAGDEVEIKAYVKPYRGERLERKFKVKIPPSFPKGEHRIVVSDADTLNRMQAIAGVMNRQLDLSQTVSLIEQERSNTKLYVSLVQSRPTLYLEDKALPNLPASVASVLQASRSATRPAIAAADTALEAGSAGFDHVISGSASVRLTVR